MSTLAADVRYALRMMRTNLGFTGVAVAALALGIAANTAIFTVVHSVLLEPLPYPEPDRIMQLGRLYPGGGVGDSNSIPKYMVWRDNQAFEAITLYGGGGPGMNLGDGDHPQTVKSLQTSAGYFQVFGVSPVIGRTYSGDEDLPGGPKVAVISYTFWQSRLGGDSGIVGRTILLNREPYTVIGVLRRGFRPDPEADVFLPMQADPNSTNQGHYLRVAGRLKPGVSLAAARAEMKIVGERFRARFPKWMDAKESVAVTPMREAMVGDVKPVLMILLGAVGLVLLIACANVANLLLARAAVRQRELAVRIAIGADRWRVVRQLLTESVLLAGLGGILGFALGSLGVRGLLMLAPGNIPRLTGSDGVHAAIPPLDWRVAAFTLAVALLTGIVFGLYPALQTSNPNLATVLKEASGRAGTGRRQHRIRSVLVVSEIALALVLITGAALLVRSFIGLQRVNPGFDPQHVFTFRTSMSTYTTSQKSDRFVTQAIRRLETVPGVEAVGTNLMLPSDCCVDLPFTIVGKPPKDGQYNGDEQWRCVAPHYFKVLKIPVVRGRAFNESDVANSARVVIINEKMARQYWPKEDPLGQSIVIGKGLGPQFEEPARQIVGIVGTAREAGLQRGELSVMYVPQSQVSDGLTALAASVIPLSWVIRSSGDPGGLRMAVEREVHSVDPVIPITEERPLEEVISASISRENFNMALLTTFAGIALLLAAIGVYGLMSYTVGQRLQEIGIRMALGAARRDMVRLVLVQGMRLAIIGIAIGAAMAYGLTRLLASLLFGVNASDPATFIAVALILGVVALVATVIPARRASSVEPSQALRYS